MVAAAFVVDKGPWLAVVAVADRSFVDDIAVEERTLVAEVRLASLEECIEAYMAAVESVVVAAGECARLAEGNHLALV